MVFVLLSCSSLICSMLISYDFFHADFNRFSAEMKCRLRRSTSSPPLYDQVQLITYMIMLGCDKGDLVQCVLGMEVGVAQGVSGSADSFGGSSSSRSSFSDSSRSIRSLQSQRNVSVDRYSHVHTYTRTHTLTLAHNLLTDFTYTPGYQVLNSIAST